MLFTEIAIETVCTVLPPHVVTSDDVEERLAPVYDRLRLPHGRLELMTGIRERRFWDPGTKPSTVAAQAGRKAIEQSGIERERIGCLVHAAVCRDFLEPATASVVHEKLKLPADCAIFDLSNACLGVLNGMVVVSNMIQAGQIEAGLVVTGETAEPLHEATIREVLHDPKMSRAGFKAHFASLTIGSSAAAVLLRRIRPEEKSPHRLLGGALRTDSQANVLCQENTSTRSESGPLMTTDSEGLLHAGIALAKKTWAAAADELGWDRNTPDRIVTHQVGSAHRRLTYEALDLDLEKDIPTVSYLGNTGSAALPGAFGIGIEDGTIKRGDKVALLGIGSGLSCLMLGVEW